MTVSGSALPARLTSLQRAAASLREGQVALTLGGCLLRRRDHRLIVSREPAAVRDTGLIRVGQARQWDGRFQISLDRAEEPLLLRALGTDGRSQLDGEGRRAGRRLPTPALVTLPSLWTSGRLVWHPLQRVAGSAAVTWGYAPVHPLAGGPFT